MTYRYEDHSHPAWDYHQEQVRLASTAQWPVGGTGQRTFAECLFDIKRKGETAALIWMGYRAGRNYYEMVHPDIATAILHGAHAMRRWWVWIIFANLWLVCIGVTAWLQYLHHHTIRGEAYHDATGDLGKVIRQCVLFLICMLFTLFITYCRNVDFSLFKRRLVYRVLRPITMALDPVPNWILYGAPCALMLLPIR